MKTALLVTLALAAPNLPPAEQAVYAGDFKLAYSVIEHGLRAEPDAHRRFGLLLQMTRAQQTARLSGLPAAEEAATVTALASQARTLGPEEQAQARHAGLVTTYFRQLTGAEKENFMSLQPAFAAVARQLKDPCRKADALFFAALMPQVSDRVLESAAGMEEARATAAAGKCELELSYAYRHLAEVAEAKGNLAEAARLSEQSLALRRQLKFQVFLPYSLLQTADYADKLGDHQKAAAQRAEALALAQRLHLPAQEKAAREAVAAKR